MRAQNNHNKKETINTMTAMSRPQSPAAAEPGEEDPAQQPQPITLEYVNAAALIAALSPLAEEPLPAGGATLDAGEGKKWSSAQGRCTQLRKLALHFEQQRGASSGILVRDVHDRMVLPAHDVGPRALGVPPVGTGSPGPPLAQMP